MTTTLKALNDYGPIQFGNRIAFSEWQFERALRLELIPTALMALTPWLRDEPTDFLERVSTGTRDLCAKVMWQAATGTPETAKRGAFGIVVSDMTASITVLAMLCGLAARKGVETPGSPSGVQSTQVHELTTLRGSTPWS